MRVKVNAGKGESILGEFHRVSSEFIDPDLLGLIQDYKSRVASKFIDTRPDDIAGLKGEYFYVSQKLDGELGFLFIENFRCYLLRHFGYAYYGLPLLDWGQEILRAARVKSCLIPGELYVRLPEGRRSRVSDLLAVTRKPDSPDHLKRVCFAPFDIIHLNDECYDSYEERHERLVSVFSGTQLEMPINVRVESRDEILELYKRWVLEQGLEGLIVRSNSGFTYRITPGLSSHKSL